MEKNRFTICANNYIDCLRQEGRYSTAHVYKHAIRSFSQFCGTQSITFSKINRETLKRYSNYLMASRLKPNTISTYMRMLRSIYNRGVDMHQAPYVHGLFRDVFTGVDTRQKKAIPIGELHMLLNKDPQSEKLRRTQAIANLLFQFCGMPFSDLAHLEKSNLERGLLKYNRTKTGTPMSIEVLESAQNAIGGLYNKSDARSSGYPDYLFRILSGAYKRNEEGAYREYQSALRRFNNELKSLSRKLRLHSPVTSYTLRHSWATTAKYRGVPIEMISESLGHKSIKTTQIYLKGLAYSDVKNLTVDRLQTFFDGNLWIITRRKKTNTESNIRLLDVPKRIIEKYKRLARDGHVFPVPSNGSCNKILKDIGRQCGFKVRLTYHVARHTNATTVLLSHGVPIETVSRLLGHTNIKTTQIYAKITAQKISQDMETLSHKLEDMEKNICRAI